MPEPHRDVIVLGAGIAGLTAARQLAAAGLRVHVIEARNRVGGRILTRRVGEEVVELGAEFIHGKPPILWNLIEEARLETCELGGRHFCWEHDQLQECGDGFGADFQWLEALKNWDRADCSFAEYLDIMHVPEATRKRLIGFVEGFNAADHRVIGVAALAKQQAIEDATEGDRMFHVRGGYAQVPEYLAQRIREADGTFSMETRAIEIRWKQGSVEVDCLRDGKRKTHPRTRRCDRAAPRSIAVRRTENLSVAGTRDAPRLADSSRPCSPHESGLSQQVLGGLLCSERAPNISMN